MSKFKIHHVTRYLYEVPVRDSANQIMLYPLKDEYQEVLVQTIKITGDPLINVHQDYFGNEVGTFTHSQPHQELRIDSQMVVVTKSKSLPTDQEPEDEQWSTLEKLKGNLAFIDFLNQEYFTSLAEVISIVDMERSKNRSPLASAKEFCAYVFENFTYKKGITTVESTLDEVWTLKLGVCQDFAHILLVMLRLMNIPARYVSGYICPSKSGMRGEGATHAWVEAYIPFYGWLGLDPTNNCLVNDTHVRLAVGKNFPDCSPVKGTYRGTSNHTLEVAVSVSYEDGHITEGTNDVAHPEPITSSSKNSYRRYQEIQMQQ
jgi:transglutaminase-like putative cysteine protease